LQHKKELVGRATASPQVKLLEESYSPPLLERYSLFKGEEFAGEILATFHLLEVRLLKNSSFLVGFSVCIYL
jgi:hypothetical protein